MTLPISFKTFSKDPYKATMFMVLCAIAYLYVDNKINYTNQIAKHENKIIVLEDKVDKLSAALKRSDSALVAVTTKLEILTQMGAIK